MSVLENKATSTTRQQTPKGLLPSVALALALSFAGQGCEDGANNSYARKSSSDQGYRKSFISVKLPDRGTKLTKDTNDQAMTLVAYQITITPTARGCGKQITDSGEYRDAYWIQLEANANCSYTVEARVGSGSAPTNVTFRSDIEPLFEKHCHECHVRGGLMEYFDSTKFDQVQIRTREIMTSILNDNMPWKREPLSPAEKELFKQWEKNQFAEGTKSLALRSTKLAASFGTGYYQTGTISVTPEAIRSDRYNLGLTPVFYLTRDGQTAGFKTPSFFSAK